MKKGDLIVILFMLVSGVSAQQNISLERNGATTIFGGRSLFVDPFYATPVGDTIHMPGAFMEASVTMNDKLIPNGGGMPGPAHSRIFNQWKAMNSGGDQLNMKGNCPGNDHAVPDTVPVSLSRLMVLNKNVTTFGLSSKILPYYGGSKDSSACWSELVNRFIFVGEKALFSCQITDVSRYWFDDAFYGWKAIPAGIRGIFEDAREMVQRSALWESENSLHYPYGGNGGNWSAEAGTMVIVCPLPIAPLADNWLETDKSAVVMSANENPDMAECLWNFGDGFAGTWTAALRNDIQPLEYGLRLAKKDQIFVLDMINADPVSVSSAVSFAIIDPVVCDTFQSPSDSYTWTTSGVYTDTLINVAGCDSVITINLEVLNSSIDTLQVSTCYAYSAPSGKFTWTSSGLYLDTMVNAAGCDSILAIDLTILEPTSSVIQASVCDEYVSPSGNYVWNTSGVYTDTITNASGCDSLITIDLTVNKSAYATQYESTYDFYISPSGNHTWTSSGTYTDTIPKQNGCDSIITVNLTVVEVDATVTNMDPVLIANAFNASYQWIDCSTMQSIPGADEQVFTATANGSYAVIVTVDGCTDTSACIQVQSIGVKEHEFGEFFNIFPNPTDGSITLDLAREFGEVMIFVRDSQGRMVYTDLFRNVSKVEMDIHGKPGTYYVEVLSHDGNKAVLKVLKG